MIGDTLKSLRDKMGISQKAFAEKYQINPSTLASYELGKREPNIDTLIKFSAIYNVSVDYLIGNAQHCSAPDNSESIETFYTLLVFLSNKQEELAREALKAFLSVLPSCFIDNKPDGKFTFDTESFILYMDTIKRISLFARWVEMGAKDVLAKKLYKDAYDSIFSLDTPSELEHSVQSPLYASYCEQINVLFSEFKTGWLGNIERVFWEPNNNSDIGSVGEGVSGAGNNQETDE